MSKASFYRWYEKLKNEGEIVVPKLTLIKSYDEANRFEIAELTQAIVDEKGSILVLEGRLNQLEIISGDKKNRSYTQCYECVII